MKKLAITNEMSVNEQKTRLMINHTIERVSNENQLKNWLIEQVTGVEIDGVTITYKWLTYEQALGYFREATAA